MNKQRAIEILTRIEADGGSMGHEQMVGTVCSSEELQWLYANDYITEVDTKAYYQ